MPRICLGPFDPAYNLYRMISTVNAYEQLICARLFDYFSSRTHWNRSLWNVGTLLALREVLEASEAQNQGHLKDTAIRGVVATALRLLHDDPGLGTPLDRSALEALLTFNGAPREEVPFQGLEYEAIKEIVEKATPQYLERWATALSATNPPAAERTSRAIASHLLDRGFHSDFLHRWWTWRFNNPPDLETPLASVLQEASALASRPDVDFEVLIPFPTPLQAPRDLLPPASWIDSTAVGEWLRANNSVIPHGDTTTRRFTPQVLGMRP